MFNDKSTATFRIDHLSSGCLVRCCLPESEDLEKSSPPWLSPPLFLFMLVDASASLPSLQKESTSTVAFPMSPMVICRKESSSSLSEREAVTGDSAKLWSGFICNGNHYCLNGQKSVYINLLTMCTSLNDNGSNKLEIIFRIPIVM